MIEIEGKVIRKYSFREPIQLNDLFFNSFNQFYVFLKRVGYEIEASDKKYDLVTIESCDLPKGARVKIKISGRILREISLLYKNKEFPVVSLTIL